MAIASKTAEPHPTLPGTIYSAAAEIEEAGGQALPLVMDVRYEEQVAAAVAATVERFGGIDVCVNNASAIMLTGTLDTPMTSIRRKKIRSIKRHSHSTTPLIPWPPLPGV